MQRILILAPLCLALPSAGCVEDAGAEGSTAAVGAAAKMPGYCTSVTSSIDEGAEEEKSRVRQTWELRTPVMQSRLAEMLAQEAPYDDEPDFGDTRTRYTVQMGPPGVRIERMELDSMLDGRTDVASSKTFIDERLQREEQWIYEPSLDDGPLQVASNFVYVPGYDADGNLVTEEFDQDGGKSIHRSTFEGGLLRRKEIDNDMDGVAEVVKTYEHREGRLVRETEEHPAQSWQNQVTTYTFDAEGRPLDDISTTPDGGQVIHAVRRTYTTEAGGTRVVEVTESNPLQDPEDPDTVTVSASDPYRDELRDAFGNVLEQRRGWDGESISEITRFGYECFAEAAVTAQ